MDRSGIENRRKKEMRKRKLPLMVLFAGLFTGSTATHAEQWGIQFVGGGADHDVKKADLGIVWDPGWKWWEIGGYHFAVVGEGHVAYWDIQEKPASHANIWEFGFTPVFRFVKSSG
jgi:lipid A 3-O-deacylase